MPKVNLILIGNQGSGKTSFVNRYVYQEAEQENPNKAFSHKYYPTIGINLERKVVNLEGQDGLQHEVHLHIWDTAGQEKFFSLTKNYFRQADGVIIMFDITDKASFFKIEEFWMKQIDENCKPETERLLVGNKIDIKEERVLDKEIGDKLAEKYKIPYLEVSAKLGVGIEEAMDLLSKKCLKAFLTKKLSMAKNTSDNIGLTNGRESGAVWDCLGRFKNLFSQSKKKQST